MSSLRSSVVLVCLLTACGAPEDLLDPTTADEQSITGGVVDSSRPAVGALVDPTSLKIFCSGTLITPTRFLSAAHCLDTRRPAQVKVAFGPSETSWTEVIAVSRVKVHPAYDDMKGTPPSDIAYVDLATPVTSITPIPAMTESITGREGESWLFMGYGADSKNKRRQWTGYGIKRSVSIPIALISDARAEFDYYAQDSGGPYATNTCYGDSGGPALASDSQGVEHVVGVTSRGDADCGALESLGIDTRVDSFASFVAEPPPVCGDGVCAAGDENCASCAADCGACTGDQCLACSSDADCGGGARCFQVSGESVKTCHNACSATAACDEGMSCVRLGKGYGNRCVGCL